MTELAIQRHTQNHEGKHIDPGSGVGEPWCAEDLNTDPVQYGIETNRDDADVKRGAAIFEGIKNSHYHVAPQVKHHAKGIGHQEGGHLLSCQGCKGAAFVDQLNEGTR